VGVLEVKRKGKLRRRALTVRSQLGKKSKINNSEKTLLDHAGKSGKGRKKSSGACRARIEENTLKRRALGRGAGVGGSLTNTDRWLMRRLTLPPGPSSKSPEEKKWAERDTEK